MNGPFLRAMREYHGYSQEFVAQILKVRMVDVESLENGNISEKYIHRLAKLYNVSDEYMIFMTTESKGIMKIIKDLILKILIYRMKKYENF